MRLYAVALCVVCFASTATAQGVHRAVPVGFTRTQSQLAVEDAATAAATVSAAALSARGRSVILFGVLGAVLLTLVIADDCGETGCMTPLPFVYGVVVGFAAGALFGWVVTAF